LSKDEQRRRERAQHTVESENDPEHNTEATTHASFAITRRCNCIEPHLTAAGRHWAGRLHQRRPPPQSAPPPAVANSDSDSDRGGRHARGGSAGGRHCRGLRCSAVPLQSHKLQSLAALKQHKWRKHVESKGGSHQWRARVRATRKNQNSCLRFKEHVVVVPGT